MPQENLTTKNTVLKGGKVLPKEDTIIYGTGANKFLVKDKSYKVHRIHAEKLIASGAATLDKPEAFEAKKKGGKKDEE